jgi:hypothetical protein
MDRVGEVEHTMPVITQSYGGFGGRARLVLI